MWRGKWEISYYFDVVIRGNNWENFNFVVL